MFTQLTIILENKQNYDYNISSLMQGVLMEFISPEYADRLHNDGLKPYTQHIEKEGDNLIWIITTMTDEAESEIIDAIISSEKRDIKIEHKEDCLAIKSKELQYVSYQELMNDTYFGKCSRTVKIDFKTPTAFKTGGRYQFYPTVELLMGSLINKHDAVSEATKVKSEEIMEEITRNVSIIGYRLRSTSFHLEGVRIPAFVGHITIRITGTQQFVNLVNLLLAFGEYSGVGIKTAIGMGAISIEQQRKEKRVERKAD